MARATIMTDASWCPHTQATGYGYWIASDRGKRPGGSEVQPAENPCHAEMMGAANAVHVAITSGLVQPGDEVLIQIDSTDAMAGLGGKPLRYEKMSKAMEVVRDHFVEFVREHELQVEFRHVKGHSYKPQARYKANNHCDRRAKTFMRRSRKKINQEKNNGAVHKN